MLIQGVADSQNVLRLLITACRCANPGDFATPMTDRRAVTVTATRAVGHFQSPGLAKHPLALGLCREHGKRVNFLGVILEKIQFDTFMAKNDRP